MVATISGFSITSHRGLGPIQIGYSSIIGRYSSKLLQDWGYSTARTEPHSSNIGTLKPPYLPSPANTYRGGYVSSYRQIRFEIGNVFRTARSHFAGTQPNDIISSKSRSIQHQPQRSPFCENGLAVPNVRCISWLVQRCSFPSSTYPHLLPIYGAHIRFSQTAAIVSGHEYQRKHQWLYRHYDF
jgi:hypothetical protein